MKISTHLYISGKVQGVYFRDSAREIAESLGLTGYVKNLPDGRVEAVVEGEKNFVDRLTQWCHMGPPKAIVSSVEIHNGPYKGEFEIFEVRR